ncbi:MAG: Beta-galactosidase trimerization domain protein [Lentisphaerae bacterium ADurb.Bin242]|nr:MAG: Beta-galactosidase trimerization domain protein [Lentisphaerae bacterium ADurb.Bin242]
MTIHRWIGVFFLPFLLTAAEVAREGEIVRLSNHKMIVEVNLARGGRVSRLLDKRSGVEMTKLTVSPGGSGLFADCFHNPDTNQSNRKYENSRYKFISMKSGEEAVLTAESPEGLPLAVRKTFILPDNSDTLHVNYELTNPGEKDLTGCFRSMNAFSFNGEKQYTIQFSEGDYSNDWKPSGKIRKNELVYLPSEGKAGDHFIRTPERDYVSVKGTKCAAVLTVPFSVLDFFYSWMSSSPDGMAVVDWFSTPFQLKPLSKGKAEAVLHSVLADPLQDYKFKFSMSVRLIDPKNFVYETYRGKSAEAKSTKFRPVSEETPMQEDFRTPALVWNPRPKSKIRLLAVAAAHGNLEMGELNRRLNTEMSLVDTSNTSAFRPTPYFGWEIPMPDTLLRPALKKNPEVILICGHHEKAVPKDIVRSIEEQVEKGAGFIYVSENNDFPSLIPKSGGTELAPSVYPGVLAGKLPSFGRVFEFVRGNGKVIWVRFNMCPKGTEWVRESRAVIPYVNPVPEHFPYWEYYFSFYGKLFRYAAGRSTPARIVSASADGNEAVLEIESEKSIPDAQIALTLDNPVKRLEKFAQWNGALKKGKNRIVLKLPQDTFLLDGEYFLNFFLSTPENTLDWFSTVRKQEGADAIAELTPDPSVYEKTEVVTGKVKLKGSGYLMLRLREAATGRVAAKQSVPDAKGEVPFRLKRDLCSSEKLYDVEAELTDGKGRLVSRRVKSVLMKPDKAPEVIRTLLWGSHVASWRELLLDRELAETGTLIRMAPRAASKDLGEIRCESESVRRAGMEYGILGVEHVICGGARTDTSAIRTPCLRDPAYLERIRARAQAVGKNMRATLTELCWISDEITLGRYFNTPHDLCQSKYCLAAFREVLKKKYGDDLARLNRNWKSSFESWDNVHPLTYAESVKVDNFASWMEHRTFMMTNLTHFLETIAGEIQAAAPGSEVGVSGMEMTRLYQGYDLPATMPFLKISCYYQTPFSQDVIRSYSTVSHRIGSWTDYGARSGIWNQLIGGLRTPSVWWYGHCFRRGDGRLSREGLHLKKIDASIRESGADLVLAHGVRKRSPITLVWSTPSLAAAGATGARTALNDAVYEANARAWSQLIRDMGLDSPNVMDSSDLRKIRPETHPVLILPLTQLLSDANLRVLENHVRDGGILIADMRPGVFDEFGTARTENLLSKVFGVKISADSSAGAAGALYLRDRAVSAALLGGRLELASDAEAFGSIRTGTKGLRLGGIRMADVSHRNAGAAVIHPYGKGKALYLNFAVSEYFDSNCRRQIESAPVVRGMTELFKAVGIDVSTAHKLPNGSNFAEYSYDGVRYLFLSRRANESDGKFELFFGGKYSVCDLFSRRFLGGVESYSGVLEPNGVAMLALLREKPGSFTGKIRFDGRKFIISAHPSPAGTPVLVRLSVSCNGKEIRALSGTYSLREKLELTADAGLEPAKGQWHITLNNLMTGEKHAEKFQIQ